MHLTPYVSPYVSQDAQSGGHRLMPDWSAASRPLGLTHGCITSSILEAAATIF
jgi:hypothetical protein